MKYLPLAALLAGLILPGSAASAPDTPASPGTIVGKEARIVNIPSNHSVDETVDRLTNILRSKEITLFALIDHSGEAAKVGVKMPPTKLLIFGNPKGGTPLMLDGLAQRRVDTGEHRQHDRNGLGGGLSGKPSCQRHARFALMENEHWPCTLTNDEVTLAGAVAGPAPIF